MKNKGIGPPHFNILVVLLGLFLTTQKKYFTYYKTTAVFWLIGIAIISTFLLQENGYFIIALLLVFIGFLEFTDHQLWKYRPFIWLFNIKDFSGTYEGTIEYLYFKEFKESHQGQKNV